MTFEEKKFGNQDLTTMNTEQQATVIIPCFNVEAYIIDCLDSVELQGGGDWNARFCHILVLTNLPTIIFII